MLPASKPPARPRTPSLDVWRTWTAEQRTAWLDTVEAAVVAEERRTSPEGRPHRTSRLRAHETLSSWFSRMGRAVYLGTEETVFYPDADPFIPDLFAVLDREDPGEDADRSRWVVADEGKGLDFVLEILVHGDRRKDLLDNVTFYAALGIPEYFVYDRKRQKLYGYRLPGFGPQRYQSIAAEGAHLASRVLGLSLSIEGGRLRFRAGEANLPEQQELLHRANGLLGEQLRRIDAVEAELQSERERAEAEKARAEAEKARADEAIAQADAEKARADEAIAQADAEKARADAEKARADEARARVEALEAALAALQAGRPDPAV